MTIAKLASAIAKLEGKKSQARIGDIREILKIIVLMEVDVMENGGDSVLYILRVAAEKKIK